MTRGPTGGDGRPGSGNLFGTPEPILAHRGRLRPLHLHTAVVKLPKETVLEEVGFLVGVLEDGVNVGGNSPPHTHVPGIVQLDVLRLLVEAPVHRACSSRRNRIKILLAFGNKRVGGGICCFSSYRQFFLLSVSTNIRFGIW